MMTNIEVEPDSSFQHSERNFRRFEKDIALLVHNYPRPTIFYPISIKTYTYVCRIRDAINAVLSPKCLWPTHIDYANLRRARQDYVFKAGSASVVFGPRKSNLASGAIDDQRLIPEITGIVDATDVEVLNALCLLKSRNILNTPTKLSNFDLELIPSLTEQYPGIAFAGAEDGTTLML